MYFFTYMCLFISISWNVSCNSNSREHHPLSCWHILPGIFMVKDTSNISFNLTLWYHMRDYHISSGPLFHHKSHPVVCELVFGEKLWIGLNLFHFTYRIRICAGGMLSLKSYAPFEDAKSGRNNTKFANTASATTNIRNIANGVHETAWDQDS